MTIGATAVAFIDEFCDDFKLTESQRTLLENIYSAVPVSTTE